MMHEDFLTTHPVDLRLHGDDRILVVDDDAAILDIIVQVLRAEGYTADGVLDGIDALAYLRQTQPEVILLDLWMPRMNGWEFRQRQAQIGAIRDIPIILLSAGGNLERHARDLGAAAAISKPFDLNSLLETVQAVINSAAHEASDVMRDA